jgi:hypothetical protein
MSHIRLLKKSLLNRPFKNPKCKEQKKFKVAAYLDRFEFELFDVTQQLGDFQRPVMLSCPLTPLRGEGHVGRPPALRAYASEERVMPSSVGGSGSNMIYCWSVRQCESYVPGYGGLQWSEADIVKLGKDYDGWLRSVKKK